MFPSPNSTDLLLQDPSLLQPDLIFDDVFPGGTDFVPTKNTKRGQKRSRSSVQENSGEETHESKLKKIMHRDIERQRRQEMANLYASLRSLLPLEYIKGKRSTSDHMQEAVNYINHMHKKMKELKMRRDKLKKLSSSSSNHSTSATTGSENGSSNSVNSTNCVSINCSKDSVEVLISCGLKAEEGIFPLSKILKELLETGLKVECCVSTKVHDKILHRIQSEAIDDFTCINLSVLQQRLANIINFP